MTTVALAGNPNCGKTTLFNALTGTRQRVGNWPGVTVERKTGSYLHAGSAIEVADLPGTYSLDDVGGALDETIARNYLTASPPDVVVNVIDATSLGRGLLLTTQLLEQQLPVVVALNMMDVADRQGVHVDCHKLANRLGCPVVPLIASREEGLAALKDAVHSVAQQAPPGAAGEFANVDARYRYIDQLLADCTTANPTRRTFTDRLDALVLNRYLAFPIFLGVVYLMFLFAINFGSAFIDLFDGIAGVIFVEAPRQMLAAVGLPDWLTTFLADGVGGGLQLVSTFIPVIGCLFLALSFLEDTGYMGRVAFIVDRLMRRLGLPGKSFVPLIVGFGCNVPAVMATRTLEREPDRILTTIMAPYMSCGARLTVYALFATAFFANNGQNVVFALYLLGIIVAVLSALAVRKYLIREPGGEFLLELPTYHLPTVKGLVLQTWQRLRGFVMRAGKAIVAVVVVLNVVSSWGTDGSFGNQDSEKSVLSAIGRTITPIFAPMGIEEDNWPATVGIFTGIFAKEVVVGTLDALYSPAAPGGDVALGAQLADALQSVPNNLAELGDQLLDPLGIQISSAPDLVTAAAEQEVNTSTLSALQNSFHGDLGAFSYLLFVLLYMPCVATIGVIYKELGGFWATFSTTWSVVVAYSAAVICYQLGSIGDDPQSAIGWIVGTSAGALAAFAALIKLGQRRQSRLIPLVTLD